MMNRYHYVRSLLAAAALAAVRPASAGVYTWASPVDGSFSDPSKWVQGTPPASDPTTQLQFVPGASYTATTDFGDANGVFTFNTLSINQSAGNTTAFALGNGFVNFNVAGASPSIALFGGGSSNIQTGIIYAGPVAQVTNSDVGTLFLHTQNFANGSTVNITNSGTGTVNLADGAVYFGNATLNLANPGGGTFAIGNMGPTASVAGSGFNGTLNVASGTVTFAGNTGGDLFGNNVILNVAAGATFNFANNPETFGGISGAGNIVLGTAGLSFVEPGDRTFAGTITGTGNVTQNAPGTLNLAAVNALNTIGTLTVANGNIALNGFSQTIAGLAGGNTLGSLPLGGATLTINPAVGTSYSFGVGLTGAGNVVVNGPGTQSLPGNNTYTGTTTVSQGTLRLNVGGLLGAGGSASFASGATLDAIVPANASAGNYFNGTGNFVKEGNGTLALNSTNGNFRPASLVLSAGTLLLDQTTDTGNKIGATIPVTLAGGTLSVNGNAATPITQSLTGLSVGAYGNVAGSSAVVVTAAPGQTTTLSAGAITHLGGSSVDFNTTGGGTAAIATTATNTNGILGGWATYNGADFVDVSTGTVSPLATYAATPAAGNNALLTGAVAVAANTSTNSIKFGPSASSTITVATGQTLNVTSGGILVPANVGANLTTITGGTLKTGVNSDLTIHQYDAAGGMNISSVIANTNGTATTATGSFATTTAVTVGSTANLFVGEQVSGTNIPSGTRVLSINSPTSITLSVAGTGNQSAGTNLTFTPGTNLVKTGPGTVTLTATNTYAGGTYIGGGTVLLPAFALGNLGATPSPVFINGGTLAVTSGSQTFSAASHPMTIGPAGATLNFSTTESFQGNGLYGTGTLTLTGPGQVSVGSNASTFSGNILVNNGSIRETSSQLGRVTGLTLAAGTAFQITDDAAANFGIAPGAPVVIAGGNGPTGSVNPGAIVLTDQSPTSTTTGVFPSTVLTNPFTFQSDTTIGVYNGSATRTAQLTLPYQVTGAGNLIKVGSGVLVLGSPNNSFGNGAGTVVIANGTLRDGIDNGVPAASILQLGQTGATTSGVFDLGGFNQTVAGFSTAGSGTTDMVVNSNAAAATGPSVLTTNIAAGTVQTFNGQLGGGTVGNESLNGFSLVKTGAGTLTLAGLNTFNGSATVAAGALRVAGNFNTARPYAVRDGATLIVTNTDPNQGPLSATSLTLGNNGGGAIGFEFAGSSVGSNGLIQITTPGGLAVNGNVNVSVSSVNPLTTGDYPLIDGVGTVSPTVLSELNHSLTLQSRAIGSLVNNTSNGSIDVNITGVDFIKYTGAVNGNWDTATANFKLNSSSTATTYRDLPSPDSVTFDDTAVGTHVVNLATTLSPASVTVNTTAGYTFGGPGSLAGNTPLTVNGPGTLTVLTNNTNSGVTTINGGSLRVGNGGTTGSIGTGAVVNNGSLVFDRSGGYGVPNNITGNGSVAFTGGGAANLSGASVIGGDFNAASGAVTVTGTTTVGGNVFGSGSITVNGGGLTIGTGGTTGTLAVDVALASGGTLAFNNSAGVVDGNAVTGTGNVSVLGGSAKLTGNVNYNGQTSIGTNTLEFGSDSDVTLNNSITGTGTLVKSGAGTLYLLGSSNGFTGTVLINQGNVVLDDLGNSGDLGAASIVVNDGTSFTFGPDNNPDLPDTTVVTVNAGGTFNLKVGEQYGGIVLNGGTYVGGNGATGAGTTAIIGYTFNSGSVTSNNTGAATLGGTTNLDKYTDGTVTFSGAAVLATTVTVNLHQGTLGFGVANFPTAGSPINFGDSGQPTFLTLTNAGNASSTRVINLQGGMDTINIADPAGVLTLRGGVTGSGGITKAGPGTLIFNGSSVANSYSGDTQVTAGVLGLAGNGSFSANGTLNVAAGATVAVLRNGTTRSVVQVGTLNNSGLVDIGSSDLFLRNTTLGAVTGQVAAGFAGGTFQGAGGITSSAAAADTNHLTAIGLVTSDGSALDGVTPNAGDVLLKYTYFGDANLDGKVDGSDYSRIDNGYLTAGSTGWVNGDFNYDGHVDGSDYTLIDNGFNRQGVSLTTPAALVAMPTALTAPSAAVPEPATVAALGVAALGLVSRRRR